MSPLTAPVEGPPRPRVSTPSARTGSAAGLGPAYVAVFLLSPLLSPLAPPFSPGWVLGVVLLFIALSLLARPRPKKERPVPAGEMTPPG